MELKIGIDEGIVFADERFLDDAEPMVLSCGGSFHGVGEMVLACDRFFQVAKPFLHDIKQKVRMGKVTAQRTE